MDGEVLELSPGLQVLVRAVFYISLPPWRVCRKRVQSPIPAHNPAKAVILWYTLACPLVFTWSSHPTKVAPDGILQDPPYLLQSQLSHQGISGAVYPRIPYPPLVPLVIKAFPTWHLPGYPALAHLSSSQPAKAARLHIVYTEDTTTPDIFQDWKRNCSPS